MDTTLSGSLYCLASLKSWFGTSIIYFVYRWLPFHTLLKIYVTLYAAVSSYQDSLNLQDDIACLWLITHMATSTYVVLRSKYEALNITNKHSPVSFTYNIGSVLVTWSSKVKYLCRCGHYLKFKVEWSPWHQHIVHRVTQSLNQLQRVTYGCTDGLKHQCIWHLYNLALNTVMLRGLSIHLRTLTG